MSRRRPMGRGEKREAEQYADDMGAAADAWSAAIDAYDAAQARAKTLTPPATTTEGAPRVLLPGQAVHVVGSKGDTYEVSHVAGTIRCTCKGFRFGGRCRHAAGFSTGE